MGAKVLAGAHAQEHNGAALFIEMRLCNSFFSPAAPAKSHQAPRRSRTQRPPEEDTGAAVRVAATAGTRSREIG